MRPLELTVDGFRSYRTAQTFDWRGRHLVGIVGPIGAGKSSILDAIAFALFGKTPTFERDTRSLIHQLSDQGHVELVFEVDGQIWRAQRALRRKGQSGHKLERLSCDGPDATAIEDVQGEKATRERVELLLGMGFDAFRRSVLLAQNRFQEFLKATPTQRNDVLKGVFGYERFDAALEVAKRRVAAAEATLAELEREGERLLRAREELDAARERAASSEARHRELDDAALRAASLRSAREEAEDRATRVRGEAATFEGVGARLTEAGDVDALADEAERAADRVAAAVRAADEAEAERARAEARLEAVKDRAGEGLEVFAELVAGHDHLAKEASDAAATLDGTRTAAGAALAAVSAREAELGRVRADAADAERALAERERAVTIADGTLHDARHAEMAFALRKELAPGEPCPVCEQDVAILPKVGRAPRKVTAAERALETARRAEAKARVARERVLGDVATAEERVVAASADAERCAAELDRAASAARTADAALAAIKSELVDRLGEGDPRALLAERSAELAAAREALDAASLAARRARGAADAVRADGDRAARDVAALAARLAQSWGLLGEARDVDPEPGAVRTAFVALGERVVALLGEAREALEIAEADAGKAAEAYTAELAAVGLGPDDDLRTAVAEAQATHAAATQLVATLEATLLEGADLERRLADTTTRRDLARRLQQDLQPSRFLGFVLEEERAALAEIGSVHLEELTGGAYRFSDDDAFRVVDLNAGGAERSSDSLSGGETFLASLALALALAEMVTRGGGRLDAFFLDEGFGSLDPEHIDRAMEGIGRLVANDAGRIVVLVSHVAEMRDAIEDLIVLDKHDVTGDTIVRSGATPGG
jgi:exonuclease SbcC